jgi:hypothetical protein
MGWLRRGDERNVYAGLRQQMLTLDPASLHLAPSAEYPRVYGGLMEMGMGGDVATLVVVADGTTSFYFSTGGGIIGAGFHEPVKVPSKGFLATLERHVDELGADPTGETPAAGMIHLRALTFDRGRLLGETESPVGCLLRRACADCRNSEATGRPESVLSR